MSDFAFNKGANANPGTVTKGPWQDGPKTVGGHRHPGSYGVMSINANQKVWNVDQPPNTVSMGAHIWKKKVDASNRGDY